MGPTGRSVNVVSAAEEVVRDEVLQRRARRRLSTPSWKSASSPHAATSAPAQPRFTHQGASTAKGADGLPEAATAERTARIADDAAGRCPLPWAQRHHAGRIVILPAPAVAGGGWLGWSHAEPQALTACRPLLRTLCDMKHLTAATEALTAAAGSVDVEERLAHLARARERSTPRSSTRSRRRERRTARGPASASASA